MALAHGIPDAVEAAYRRGDLLEKRTRLMEDWAKFIDTPPAAEKGTVTPIKAPPAEPDTYPTLSDT